ncbi:methyltransferase domain-containing protein [Maribacter sp. R77961]|uniref:methyltransferase domain-containing protein n=1 Tax=Maribacter sp. R77961 TaxID=3093871 RepID=UPI0037CA289E
MNSEDYNALIAYHYQSYRPPLHAIILKNYLSEKKFDYGLDIGCGTGKSTVALKQFCKETVGVDPSKAMLAKTAPEQGITYEYFNGLQLHHKKDSYDVITLAGSWWYGKSQTLLNDIVKVGRRGAPVFLYDFEILLAPIYQKLQLKLHSHITDYDHFIDFNGFNMEGLQFISKVSDEVLLKVTAQELAHLICSEQAVLKLLQLKFDDSHPFKKLVNELENSYKGKNIELLARTFSTSYKIVKR